MTSFPLGTETVTRNITAHILNTVHLRRTDLSRPQTNSKMLLYKVADATLRYMVLTQACSTTMTHVLLPSVLGGGSTGKEVKHLDTYEVWKKYILAIDPWRGEECIWPRQGSSEARWRARNLSSCNNVELQRGITLDMF